MGLWTITSQNVLAQNDDPGAVGAGVLWTDINANLTYRRNDLNTDWILIGSNTAVSNTEYGYLDGVTSAIQTQLDAKATTGTALTESAELNNTPITDDTDVAIGANTLVISKAITMPSTEKYYFITGLEWKNGATVNGSTTPSLWRRDDVSGGWVLLAWGEATVNTGASAVQRVSLTSSSMIRAGTVVRMGIHTGSGTHTYRELNISANGVVQSLTYTVNPPNGILESGSTAADDIYAKIYFRGIE